MPMSFICSIRSEPHTWGVGVSEPRTRNVSGPHTWSVGVSEPHTRNVDVSEPYNLGWCIRFPVHAVAGEEGHNRLTCSTGTE